MKSILLLYLITISLLSCTYGQDPFLQQLESSPRHHEWVQVSYQDRAVECFLVYPEVSGKAPVILLIHENRGLNNWARAMADDWAAAGYIVIAPDLLSGAGPGGGKTSDFANEDDARTALYALAPDQVTNDLRAVLAYGKSIPAASGVTVVAGFCWGGSQSFRFATNSDEMDAACVFYGSAPDDAEALARISVPVYGFYGGNDARVNATIEATEKHMKTAGKTYDYEIYEGAGHAYMRSGALPNADPANEKARNTSLSRFRTIMEKL